MSQLWRLQPNKHHGAAASTTTSVPSRSSGCTSELRRQQGWFLLRLSLGGRRLSSSHKDASHAGLGPTLVTSF